MCHGSFDQIHPHTAPPSPHTSGVSLPASQLWIISWMGGSRTGEKQGKGLCLWFTPPVKIKFISAGGNNRGDPI